MLYQVARSVLFQFPPEQVHHFSMHALRKGLEWPIVGQLIRSMYKVQYPKPVEAFGLTFANPVGLGAGFDKNAHYLRALSALGFGHVEVGTVTPKPQPGNEQPRLFRLPQDKALINRMGFNNNGVKAVAGRLIKWREAEAKAPTSNMIIGGNLGKNKVTDNDEAWKDYEICFQELFEYVDYFTVNVSSPNTPGLRALQEKDALLKILGHLQHINQGKALPKPILLKIAPDLTHEQLDDIVVLANEVQLSGIVATNTTISRQNLTTPAQQIHAIGMGGLSGLPVQAMSTAVVQYLHEQLQGKIPIIASGGIFTGADAEAKLQAGATLVQVWTGFVYQGPAIVQQICNHLAKRI
ncbi:MAG TPA: dihydroorotate dehydrogenase (quinone) [Chitinophagaceae bacterium]|nr:dihydroorotate dehydrogenase (quinone) [Chitinophagaceae bacterium]HAN37837.1 dihydroorotate dehydrogenase (quinone) [Chitinophagaceae bacterium]